MQLQYVSLNHDAFLACHRHRVII